LAETASSTGVVVSRYTQEPDDLDAPLAELRSTTTSYYEADALGSVTSLTNSSGALANSYNYDSFGKVTNSSGSLQNPFQFAGRDFDDETQLYYNRARYFDSALGRFVSEDPIGWAGGTNLYEYVRNEPTIFTDPSGLITAATADADTKCLVCTVYSESRGQDSRGLRLREYRSEAGRQLGPRDCERRCFDGTYPLP